MSSDLEASDIYRWRRDQGPRPSGRPFDARDLPNLAEAIGWRLTDELGPIDRSDEATGRADAAARLGGAGEADLPLAALPRAYPCRWKDLLARPLPPDDGAVAPVETARV